MDSCVAWLIVSIISDKKGTSGGALVVRVGGGGLMVMNRHLPCKHAIEKQVQLRFRLAQLL